MTLEELDRLEVKLRLGGHVGYYINEGDAGVFTFESSDIIRETAVGAFWSDGTKCAEDFSNNAGRLEKIFLSYIKAEKEFYKWIYTQKLGY